MLHRLCNRRCEPYICFCLQIDALLSYIMQIDALLSFVMFLCTGDYRVCVELDRLWLLTSPSHGGVDHGSRGRTAAAGTS